MYLTPSFLLALLSASGKFPYKMYLDKKMNDNYIARKCCRLSLAVLQNKKKLWTFCLEQNFINFSHILHFCPCHTGTIFINGLDLQVRPCAGMSFYMKSSHLSAPFHSMPSVKISWLVVSLNIFIFHCLSDNTTPQNFVMLNPIHFFH